MPTPATSKPTSKVVRKPKLRQSKSDQCAKATVILERSHDSVNALFRAYELARAQRGKPRGISTDDEQDLLRAMLIMAASGLDAMLKQLVRDAMPSLASLDKTAEERLREFVTKSLRGSSDNPEGLGGASFLARVLGRPPIRAQ